MFRSKLVFAKIARSLTGQLPQDVEDLRFAKTLVKNSIFNYRIRRRREAENLLFAGARVFVIAGEFG